MRTTNPLLGADRTFFHVAPLEMQLAKLHAAIAAR
jgi:hypothetical protein